MAPKDYALLSFLIPMLVAISLVDSRMRLAEPKRRIGMGVALICIAPLIFIAMMSIPTPDSSESDISIRNIVVMGVASAFSGTLVLAILLIAGGLFQTFKRCRYYRKKGR